MKLTIIGSRSFIMMYRSKDCIYGCWSFTYKPNISNPRNQYKGYFSAEDGLIGYIITPSTQYIRRLDHQPFGEFIHLKK